MSQRRPLAPVLLALLALLPALAPVTAHATELTKLVDPDTSARWEGVFGAGESTVSTENAGRIWADKSVYASADAAIDAGFPVRTEVDDHSFIVGLSTLASAVSVRQEGGPAHDVVFVVSTNRLLEDVTYGGRPQADYLVDALNQAIARYDDYLEDNPGSKSVEVDRAICIFYTGDVDRAISTLEEFVAQDDTFGPAWANLGMFYESEERIDDARAAYEHAIETDPDDAYGVLTYAQQRLDALNGA